MRLAEQLFAEGSPADLVQRYARTLPLVGDLRTAGAAAARTGRNSSPGPIRWRSSPMHSALLRMIGGLMKMRRYLQGRLRIAREQGGEGLIAELVRVEKEGGRITPGRDGLDAVSAARRRFGDHDASDQRRRSSNCSGIRTVATGWRRTGAVRGWRWKNSCASSRRCNSPSRAMCARMSISTAVA